jgi:hypothetical protein
MELSLKLPFGIKDGILIGINQVERGLACNCFCPCCNHPLVARKGESKIHHFAHASDKECEGAVQTALHMAAKEILQRNKRIFLPEVIGASSVKYKVPYIYNDFNREAGVIREEQSYRTRWTSIKISNEGYVDFDEVLLEKRFENIIPDIVLIKNDIKLFVEIAVTHFVDEKKLRRIREMGISALEIDISTIGSISLQELENLLVNRLDCKKWIFNRRGANFPHEEFERTTLWESELLKKCSALKVIPTDIEWRLNRKDKGKINYEVKYMKQNKEEVSYFNTFKQAHSFYQSLKVDKAIWDVRKTPELLNATYDGQPIPYSGSRPLFP